MLLVMMAPKNRSSGKIAQKENERMRVVTKEKTRLIRASVCFHGSQTNGCHAILISARWPLVTGPL